MSEDNPLRALKDSNKLIITPHIAWASVEARTNLMRVLVDPTRAVTLGSKGEFGWDGWLGCYMEVVPEQKMCIRDSRVAIQRRDADRMKVGKCVSHESRKAAIVFKIPVP